MESHGRRTLSCTSRILPAFGLAGLSVLASCSETPRERELSGPRETSIAGATPRLHAPIAERFALQMPSAKAQRGLSWDTPDGWLEREPTALRVANFRVAEDERAECYLTLLAGDAGGLAANVNRWRAQLSQPALSADAIEQLPRCELLGREAVLLDVRGTWTGMSGADSIADQRLLGALLVQPEGSAFLKMVGPADRIEAEIEHFKALARSLRATAQ